MKLEVIGLKALSELIDALTTQQTYYKLTVSTDIEQAFKDSDSRAFGVEIEEDDEYE